jgi:hypothetical protein
MGSVRAGALDCLATQPYVARPHPLADKFIRCRFGDSFGQLPFVHGDPFANQFDGSFLIGFICKEIPHGSRFSLGIESGDPNLPPCCHSWHYAPRRSEVNSSPLITSIAGSCGDSSALSSTRCSTDVPANVGNAKVSARAGSRILLARTIEAIIARFQLADHQCFTRAARLWNVSEHCVELLASV